MKTYKSAVAILSKSAKTFSANYAHGQAETENREVWCDMCDNLDRKGIEYSTSKHGCIGGNQDEITYTVQVDQVAHA